MSEDKKTPKKRLPRPLKIFLWVLLVIFILVLLLAVSACAIVGSAPGRNWLVNHAVTLANRSPELNIEAQGLTLPKLGHWQANYLAITTKGKTWLEVRDFQLDWQPQALLKRNVIINNLEAESIRATTPPPGEEPEQPEPKEPMQLPDLAHLQELSPVNVKLERLHVSQLELYQLAPEGPLSETQELQIDGELTWLDGYPLYMALTTERTNAEPLNLAVHLRSEDFKQFNLNGKLTEAAGGMIGQLLQLPSTRQIDANFDLDLATTPDQLNATINDLNLPVLDRNIHGAGDLLWQPASQKVVLQPLTLDIDDSTHTIQGYLEGETLNVDVDINQFPLDIVKMWTDAIQSGDVDADLHLDGTLSAPQFKGQISAETAYQEIPINLNFQGDGTLEQVNISQLDAHLADAHLKAQGSLSTQGTTKGIDISLTNLSTDPLRQMGIPIPEELSAKVESIVGKLSGTLTDPDGELSINGNGSYRDEPFTLQAQANRKGDTIDVGNVRLDISDGYAAVKGKLNPNTLNGQFDVTVAELPFTLAQLADVQLPDGLSGKLNSNLAVDGDLTLPNVDGDANVVGEFQAIPFDVNLDATFADWNLQLSQLTLDSGDERVVTANGKYTPDAFDLRLLVDALPTKLLSALGYHMPEGQFNADINTTGTPQDPRLNGQIDYKTRVKGYDPENENREVPANWHLDIATSDSDLTLASTLKLASEAPEKINIKVPTKPYLDHFLSGEPQPADSAIPLQANLNGEFGLESLALLTDLGSNIITGSLVTDMTLTGDVNNPQINGQIKAQNVTYENYSLGTVLPEINCEINARQQSLSIDQCAAEDDTGGKINLGGKVDLPLPVGSPGAIDIKLTTDSASLIRRQEIDSEVTASVTVKGDFNDMTVAGDIDIAPLTASIESNMVSSVPEIKITETKSGGDEESEDGGKASGPNINLDMKIFANNQAFLRGRGLEAELAGEVFLKGTAQAPVYDGEFNTVRGTFEVFNKEFELDQGQVVFTNNAVGLNILGIYTNEDAEIRAEITGTTSDLKINFSSDPSMPEDEILSYIIFGKSVQDIGPLEAYQLASAVQQLRGGGGGLDLMGTARDALGVDTLSIESAETEDGQTGVNVGIGKYINDRVYLEVERTPDPTQPWRGVLQIELTPNLNLESSTGGQTGTEGAKLKWKHDY